MTPTKARVTARSWRGLALRICAAAAVMVLIAVGGPLPTATAVPPPHVDPAVDIAPPDGDPGPALPMKQNTNCATSVVMADSQFGSIPASSVFNVSELHKYARGDGQIVAVIDSGVQPVSRLPRLRGGGDYLMRGDGLSDCDHHGTLVAGIIAAQPSATDAFVGVAPGAEILSIRQTSAAFTLDNPPQGYTENDKSAANMLSLAESIVHAANLGATVINLSVTACLDAGSPVDLHALAGALDYAVRVKDVVIVTAAGNLTERCQPNPGFDPANPGDKRNWDGVRSISLPSYYWDHVLSVGGSELQGDPYANSMPGPWVGVAAPAMNIVSLDPTEPTPGALTNGSIVKGVPTPINGTSFASAYVAGLAALIREKYSTTGDPRDRLSAHQVINRILQTAHTPADGLNNVFGYGLVDPVAALTANVPKGDIVAPGIPSVRVDVPAPAPPRDRLGEEWVIGFGIAAIAVVAVLALALFAFGGNKGGSA
ncbi:type VII secretion-associated serine protease mycosin [Mycobacteroides abscessus]|uniref:type VII secretion-associated serine protease mycosin n=1 Tax=Mycobacteroides abscessus TaxID=36809 RepID=UPI000C25ADC8|nr:type VII secretion-associated serine protease mycosin [Mycobacteroides abscessus]